MRYAFKDLKYNFKYFFDSTSGAYVRTGILDKNGNDTGVDPFMASFPHLIDVGIMGHCKHGKSGLCAYSRTSTTPSAMPTDRRKFNCLSFWNSSSSTYTYSTSNVSAAKPVVFYQGYGKSFDNLVYFETLDQLIANASAIRKFATG